MEIKLKQIHLSNFKGIADLTFDFAGKVSVISGANGTGKTSVYDAFLWCLFGKNSDQNAKFSVATLDSNGEIVKGCNNTVQLTLLVDGKETTLERSQENKKSGASTTTYVVDGFKKLKKEFDEYVSTICNEQLFKAITSASYFTSLKWQEQRAFLMSLCDLSSIELNPEFKEIMDLCKANNASITDYNKRLQQDIKTLKKTIDEQNSIINVLSQQNTEINTDWDALLSQKNEAEQKLSDLEAGNTNVVELQKQKSALQSELYKEQHNNQSKAREVYYSENQRQFGLKAQVKSLKTQIDEEIRKETEIKEKITTTEAERAKLEQEFDSVSATKLEFSESDFRCPTCGRPFEADQIATKQQDMIAQFNANKTAKLEQLNKDGVAKLTSISQYENQLAECHKHIETFNAEIAKIEADPLFSKEIKEPTTFEESDKEKQLKKDIEALDKTIAEQSSSDRLSDIADIKAILGDLNKKLGVRGLLTDNEQKIALAEKKIQSTNKEILKLEQKAALIADGQKVLTSEIEKQVNSRFTMAQFKLFDTLVSGEQVETCTATYQGVPYADLNTASKINIGLDIIRVICAQRNVFATIFIDGAESVNNILPTDSQQIQLTVTTEQQLTLVNNQ